MEDRADIPVIMLTGVEDKEFVMEGIKLGICDYILKPFFPDDLLCILAGLTPIRPLRFFVIALIARPWGLLVACAVGGSTLALPWWGMALLGAAGLAFFGFGLKYGDKLEEALLRKLKG